MSRPTNSIRKLSKTGRGESLSVVIPSEIVRQLKFKVHQGVLIKKISGAIVIRDAKTKHGKK